MAKPPVNWNNVDMLTPGMKNLGNQFNKRWKSRYGDSDGAIGDYAHQQGTSDHNPDDTSYGNAGWDGDSDKTKDVRAIDVDATLNESGTSMQDVIDHMRRLPNLGSVIRYMIYDGKMYHVDDDFEPKNYTGSNDHSQHAHFSGARSESADQNTTFNFKFEEVGMPSVEEIWNFKDNNPYDGDKPVSMRDFLSYAPSLNRIGGRVYEEIKKVTDPQFAELDAKNAELSTKVDALTAAVAELTALIEGHVSGLIEAATE